MKDEGIVVVKNVVIISKNEWLIIYLSNNDIVDIFILVVGG